jgi:hypothetical protein
MIVIYNIITCVGSGGKELEFRILQRDSEKCGKVGVQ